MMTPREAIKEAARRVGGAVNLSVALGLSPARVGQMIKAGRVPPEHILRIEMITGVPRHLFNPVIYPPPIVVDLTEKTPTTESTPA